MNTEAHHLRHALHRDLLALEQKSLRQTLERVINSLGQARNDRLPRHLVDVSICIRKHKHRIIEIVQNYPDKAAEVYLDLLNCLRRDVANRMALLATGHTEILLIEEFETLCWETLSQGVLWLDHFQSSFNSEPDSQSYIGDHWAYIWDKTKHRDRQTQSNRKIGPVVH